MKTKIEDRNKNIKQKKEIKPKRFFKSIFETVCESFDGNTEKLFVKRAM